MAGPWEKYGAQQAPASPAIGLKDQSRAPDGPWSKYAAPREDRVDQGFAVAGAQDAAPDLQAALDRKAAGYATGGARGQGGFVETLDAGIRGAADMGSFGLADEISAGLNTGAGMWGDYGQELARQRAIDAYDAQQHGGVRLAGQLAGGVAGAGAMVKNGATLAGRAAGQGLLPRIGLGAAEGAAYGAGYGAGSGEGAGDRAIGALEGGVIGGALGGALPAVSGVVSAAGKPIADATRARVNPRGYATQKVVERLTSDGGTVGQAANRIQRAAQGGDSMSLADVGGENVKGLVRSAVNIPGPARERITAQTNLSALGQGERLKRLVGEAFANPDGAYQAAKSAVMDARSTAAEPYYKVAYSRPIPYTFNIEDLLNTPAGRAGLAAAKKNSANRREPWAQWFASVDDAGNIIDKRRVPDTRALDEVQRVLRGMEESAKRPADGSPFGKAIDTPESIAIRSVHRDLLKEMDAANPAFARARAVGLDNIQADEALEFGRNALRNDARVNARRMGDPTSYGRDTVFNDGQKELARIGLAEALREQIDKSGLTHNALLKFFSTREQIARIRPFFKSNEDWKAFRSSIINEARKRATYNAVKGNSTTARQLLDAQETARLGDNIGNVVDIGTKAATGRHVAAAMNALQVGLQRLAGMTPEVADHVGRLLMTRDPATVRSIMSRIQQIEKSKVTADRKATAIRMLLTNALAGNAAQTVDQMTNVPPAQPRIPLAGPQLQLQ